MKVKCKECNGRGWGVWSCCTGLPVDLDIMMCHSCGEHLGEEDCQVCDATGMVDESEQTDELHYVRQSYRINNGTEPNT